MVKSESESHSVVSDSLQPHGLYSPWNMVKGLTYNPGVIILFCLNFTSALVKGCRCLEIDCWDGSQNEPVVYHGYTFTSKLLFKTVIQAIHKYAFVVCTCLC